MRLEDADWVDLKKERIAIDETSPVTPMTALVIDADGHLTYMGEDGCRRRIVGDPELLARLQQLQGKDWLTAMSTAIDSCSWSRQTSQDQPKVSSFFGLNESFDRWAVLLAFLMTSKAILKSWTQCFSLA